MLSPKYATPLHLDLKPSRILFALLCFMHGGAVLILLIIPIPAWLSVFLFFLIALELFLQTNLHVRMCSKQSVVRLIWLESSRWKIFYNEGTYVEGVLLGQIYLHKGLVILRFQTIKKEKKSVIIFIDNITSESHRKLRVRLRLQADS